ncbi:hypothetical protein TERTU_1785 [Teredinibacter turnerae T7901]|uniref:Uncharacterized protein n=1 Tax=Teredinibacter turnerae (strain ATCC 39867 / T7901) TaxID=377629 RepID=C5BHR2_TERTT|nr:hypothetical protein TERTU_1785 [Teredinibacter turnerae T7901]
MCRRAAVCYAFTGYPPLPILIDYLLFCGAMKIALALLDQLRIFSFFC